ncbi:unnamed protein product [Heligmosomoides polygyrus]|uniref:WH2 domain-containing protein n=1 Tax=Heligmosomoides polygyrus TaxID=6339 RepID=A0A183FZ88_HELPZ|nr:unnamed protein product [Heligmosomoides polygyrus]
MGDQGVELKESPPKTDTAPPSPPPPPPPLTTTIPEKQDVPVIPAHTARFARIDNLPRIGRRVSSVEAVKGAPPPKRQSVVVFESPDTPPPTQYVQFVYAPYRLSGFFSFFLRILFYITRVPLRTVKRECKDDLDASFVAFIRSKAMNHLSLHIH